MNETQSYFQSMISYNLGIAMGKGLFENYPDGYNNGIGPLSTSILKLVSGWGNEICPHDKSSETLRRECSTCWVELVGR